MPQISVIVPVYKVEAYLSRCIDSILAQSFLDFELILVDDGSPDRSGVICDEYAQKDTRIKVIHQENGGLSAARNAGMDWLFANSNSEWITFIDSDDWIHPEYLERLLDAAIKNNAAVSVCHYVNTEGEEPVIAVDELQPKVWKPETYYVDHNVNATIACAKLYRKECFRTIRYPLGKIHEDEFITYQILFRFPTIAVISAPLYFYYVNPDSIMQSGQSRLREDKHEALEQQIQYFRDNHFALACRSQAIKYLENIHYALPRLSREPENVGLFKNLKRRKRKFLYSYARFLDLTKDGDACLLTEAFPRRMWIYWNIKAIMHKLRIIR